MKLVNTEESDKECIYCGAKFNSFTRLILYFQMIAG